MEKDNLKNKSNNSAPQLDSLIKQLDKWISDCELQSAEFFKRGMEVSEVSSIAMKVAYLNVKNFLKNSK